MDTNTPVSRKVRLARLLPSRLLLSRAQGALSAIGLTFDDGPDPEWTPQILDILRRYEARATFFLIGRFARAYPELTRRIADEGHLLGCHTDNHVDLSRLPFREAWQECREGRESVAAISGRPVRYLRPPWGRIAPSTFAVAKLERMALTLWSVDGMDHCRWDTPRLMEHLRQAAPCTGDILLYHDDTPNTVDVLPQVLEYFRDRGLACLTLEELLRPAHQPSMRPAL
jgi:peptidoglycan-N-acetylglucosamine deacetylase